MPQVTRRLLTTQALSQRTQPTQQLQSRQGKQGEGCGQAWSRRAAWELQSPALLRLCPKFTPANNSHGKFWWSWEGIWSHGMKTSAGGICYSVSGGQQSQRRLIKKKSHLTASSHVGEWWLFEGGCSKRQISTECLMCASLCLVRRQGGAEF